jgi:hypothetical protein
MILFNLRSLSLFMDQIFQLLNHFWVHSIESCFQYNTVYPYAFRKDTFMINKESEY